METIKDLYQKNLGYLSGVNFENADGDLLRSRDIDGVTARSTTIAAATRYTPSRRP
jgi:hypothetical protein